MTDLWFRQQLGTFLNKKEWAGELNNIEKPGRPRKTANMNDHRNYFIENPHECKIQRFISRCRITATFEKRKFRLALARNFTYFWNILCEMKPWLTIMTRREGEGKQGLMIRSISYHLLNMSDRGMCGCLSVQLCDGLTGVDWWSDSWWKGSGISSEVYRVILSAQIQSNAAKLKNIP